MIITVTCNPSFDKTLEVPCFAPGRTLKARTLHRQPAGKGVNVSRCIAALGGRSAATGFLGRAEIPIYAGSFEQSRAVVDFVPVAGDTRQNVTIRDPERNAETHLREEGFSVAPADVAALERKLSELAAPGDVVIFSGSLPPGMQPADLARLVRLCAGAGCSVAVDSSGPALAEAVQPGVWLAKPNRDELEELVSRAVQSDEDVRRAAAELRETVEILLVTLGDDGAICFANDRAWKAAVKVDVVRNSVGTGDAFLAGFIVAHLNGQPPDACLCRAVACGAAATQELWAGRIDPAIVEKLLARVTLAEF